MVFDMADSQVFDHRQNFGIGRAPVLSESNTVAFPLRPFGYAALFSIAAGDDNSIRSRIALPDLKCGMCFGGTTTDSPVFGFLPVRAGR